MNERIKELALEAFQPINDIASEGIADSHTFNQAWFQLYNQKFAELIVRECARISVEADETMTNQGKASAQAFMEYFGVKE